MPQGYQQQRRPAAGGMKPGGSYRRGPLEQMPTFRPGGPARGGMREGGPYNNWGQGINLGPARGSGPMYGIGDFERRQFLPGGGIPGMGGRYGGWNPGGGAPQMRQNQMAQLQNLLGQRQMQGGRQQMMQQMMRQQLMRRMQQQAMARYMTGGGYTF